SSGKSENPPLIRGWAHVLSVLHEVNPMRRRRRSPTRGPPGRPGRADCTRAREQAAQTDWAKGDCGRTLVGRPPHQQPDKGDAMSKEDRGDGSPTATAGEGEGLREGDLIRAPGGEQGGQGVSTPPREAGEGRTGRLQGDLIGAPAVSREDRGQ